MAHQIVYRLSRELDTGYEAKMRCKKKRFRKEKERKDLGKKRFRSSEWKNKRRAGGTQDHVPTSLLIFWRAGFI